MEKEKVVCNLFYKKRANLERSLLIEKRVRILQSNPVPLAPSTSILDHTQIFKVFNKQNNALKTAREASMGLMVFAFEGRAVGDGGRRNFLVCHPRILWKNIKDRPPDYRCTYEVIPEGVACKLYFDIEFSKELNPEFDGSHLVSIFTSVINYFLQKEFSIMCGADHVLDLESSREKKFSRHLIYNHPEIYFENNYHVGRFVNMICENLKHIHEKHLQISIPNITHDDLQKLFVKTNSCVGLVCDRGVYTKNRNFRVYSSTKFGKCVPLVISKENIYNPTRHTDSNEENYFLDSLITFIPSGVKTLKYGSDSCHNSKLSSIISKVTFKDGRDFNKESASPYPEIELFINNFLGEENIIRTWQYFSDTELLVLDIDKRHRYCNNIGREHKSNSVMYVVNLRAGVFYQKCHDPDCIGYKSNEIKLPVETMPWKLLAEHESEDTDDEVLVAAAEVAERKYLENINNNNNLNIPSQMSKFNENKRKEAPVSPSFIIIKDKDNIKTLPNISDKYSKGRTQSCVEKLNSSNTKSTSTMVKESDPFQECVSDEEMLQVCNVFEPFQECVSDEEMLQVCNVFERRTKS